MRAWLGERTTPVVTLVFVVLVFGSAWSTLSAVNAIFRGGEGSDGSVFWPAVAIVALAALLLLGLTWQALVELSARIRR